MIDNKDNIDNEEYNETIDIIVRQTELSRDEAIVLLDKNQNNYMKALEEHFGIKPKITSIEIFDALGRKITSTENINETEH